VFYIIHKIQSKPKSAERVLSSETVFTCPVFKVEHAEVELRNGARKERWYVVKKDAVGIIAIDGKNRLLLTKEYRSASGSVEWWIPAGGLEGEESPEEGAHREFREETSLDAKRMDLIMVKKAVSSVIKQSTHFFLARDLFDSPLKTDEYEEIKVVPTEISEVVKKLRRGEIRPDLYKPISAAIKIIKQDSAK
jgi:8-oxo-dGTP pyrophosphatase MutT (NUDIX family)